MALIEALPILTPDRQGYVLDGEKHAGFDDRRDLSDDRRRAVARWASRFSPGALTPEQAELLEAPNHPTPEVLEAAQGLIDARGDLQLLHLSGMLDELSEQQRGWLAHPGTHPDLNGTASFPLTVGEMAVLVGVNEPQLRRWSDAAALPSFRWGDDRRFGRHAAARAMIMAEAPKPEKAAICATARGEGRRTVLMIGALLDDALARSGADNQEQREALARTLREASNAIAPAVAASDPAARRKPKTAGIKRSSDRPRHTTAKHATKDDKIVIVRATGKKFQALEGGKAVSKAATQREAVEAAKAYLTQNGGGVLEMKRGRAIARVQVPASPRSAGKTTSV